jgi:hypothetical protein
MQHDPIGTLFWKHRTSPTTITGNGGINLIAVTGAGDDITAALTLSGGANDYFVFDVSGNYHTNNGMTLSGGVSPDHILFVFTGTSGNVFQTSGGGNPAQWFGTFLATDGGAFQLSELNLDGALIMGDSNGAGVAGGGDVQFVSGSEIPTFSPFTVPAPSIGHGILAFLAVGGMLFGGKLLERSKKLGSLAA